MRKFTIILDKEVKTENGQVFDRARMVYLNTFDKLRFLINTYMLSG